MCVTQINTECMWMPTISLICFTNSFLSRTHIWHELTYVTNSSCIPIAYIQARTCATQTNTECTRMPTTSLIYVTNSCMSRTHIWHDIICHEFIRHTHYWLVRVRSWQAFSAHECRRHRWYISRTHICHELISTGSYGCDPDKHLMNTNADDIADIYHELIYATNSYLQALTCATQTSTWRTRLPMTLIGS